jgi:hypothetical protein
MPSWGLFPYGRVTTTRVLFGRILLSPLMTAYVVVASSKVSNLSEAIKFSPLDYFLYRVLQMNTILCNVTATLMETTVLTCQCTMFPTLTSGI